MDRPPRRIGYARCSTEEQNLRLQLDALKSADCDQVFTDKGVSAVAKHRAGFEQVLSILTSGDTLVLWKLDRAFRSLRDALEILERFEREGIHFLVLTEGIDTATPMGRCFYQIQNAFAELECNLISERTRAGLKSAKARGVTLGRPKRLTASQRVKIRKLIDDGVDKNLIAKKFGVSTRTIYRVI